MKTSLSHLKIAIVCDWLKDYGWAEQVLRDMLEIFPQADIYSSVYFTSAHLDFLKWKNVQVSYIQKLPFFAKRPKLSLTFRPTAFESFDLSAYDIVICSTSAESKWVITKPDCLQICYCHTPTRYFWSDYHRYKNMMEFGILNPIWKILMFPIIHKLRLWDFVAAQRPDYFIANSHNTTRRIRHYYGRESEVIYPGVDVSEFTRAKKKKDFYLAVSRCIPYKKLDLLVDTFNQNGKKLTIVTNTNNKLYKTLKDKSEKNISWKLSISRKETIKLYSEAKAFLFPAEEDFGITPLEACASHTPVIAFAKWWALETVIDGKTGVFFSEQNTTSLSAAIERFEAFNFQDKDFKKQVERFEKKVFQKKLEEFIREKLQK